MTQPSIGPNSQIQTILTMKKVSISTITPVYAGERFLPDLIAKIEQLRDLWKNSKSPLELAEAIFVNDDSSDKSLPLLYEIEAQKSWVKVINLSRNFGQHQATIAGILYSSGDWIVSLDEDLQHDPAYINTLLESAVNAQQDVVYATPEQPVHESIYRDVSSMVYKKLVSLVTGNKHVRKFNSFRLIRGPIARASGSVCTHGTYYDIVLGWFTNRVSSIRLPLKDQRYSESGTSGYTFRKLLSHARRMIVSSEAKIVRFGAAMGFMAVLIAIILGFKIFMVKLFFPESVAVQGWTSLFLVILFSTGLLAILLGIALEYISVILLHIQGKPSFFIIDRSSDRALVKYYSEIGKN